MTITKKITAIAITIIMSMLLVFAALPASDAHAAETEPFVVVLNPGHGPSKTGSGAVVKVDGDTVKESILNEKLTKAVYDALTAKGITVYITNPMTRFPLLPHIIKDAPKTGVQYEFLDPAELLPAINTPWVFDASIDTRPTIGISIHHNSNGTYPNSAAGYEIFYSSTITNNYGKNSKTVADSRKLATLVNAEFKKDGFYLAPRTAPIKDADVNSINKFSGVPTILIEAGFMTNEKDLAAIRKTENMEAMAARIATAVAEYRNEHIAEAEAPYLLSMETSANPSHTPEFWAKAVGVTDASGVKTVQFKVWNEKLGADTAKWYKGTKSGSDWQMTANVEEDFKNKTGKYYIEAYGTDVVGNKACMGIMVIEMDHIDTSAPMLNSITKSQTVNNPKMSVTANITDDKSGIKSVKFKVYTKKGGTDDAKTIKATNEGNGNWKVSVNALTQYKSKRGTYVFDCYAEDKAGNSKKIGSTELFLSKDSKTPTAKSITKSQDPSLTADFTITLSGVSDASGMKAVKLVVWTKKNGQDDRDVVSARYQGNNVWKATVSAKDHGNAEGTYNIHAYGWDNWGNKGFLKSTTIKLDHRDSDKPTLEWIEKTKTVNNPKMTVEAKVKDDRSGVKNVKFKVYTKKNGKDDVRTIAAEDMGGGVWKVAANAVNDFKSARGTYVFECYATDKEGNTGKIGQTTVFLSKDSEKPKADKMTIADNPSKTEKFTVTLTGVKDVSGMKSVKLKVWTKAGGKDDLDTVKAKYQGNNVWKATVSAKDHGNKEGTYYVHAYGYDNWGTSAYLKGTTVKMDHIDADDPYLIKIDAHKETTNPKMTVAATVKDDESGIKNVKFKVYTKKNGTDDAKTITAESAGDGVYKVSVNAIDDFRSARGTYVFDCYATDKAGNSKKVGSTTVYLSKETNSPTLESIDMPQSPTTSKSFTVTALGVTDASGMKNVKFGIWSKAGGQDDIEWYKAKYLGGNMWQVDFDIKNHGGDLGVYNIHVYGTDNWGNTGFMKSAQVEIITYVAEGDYAIMGSSATTAKQMADYYKAKRGEEDYPAYYTEIGVDLLRFCELYMEEAAAEGINAEVAFTQAMKETGWLQFGGIVPVEYFNFCGLGALNGNETGKCADFSEYGENEKGIRMGIRAQIQHLKCYASTEDCTNEIVDPRWDVVVDVYGRGFAPTVNALSGTWAQGSGSENYGPDICKMIDSLLTY